MLGGQSIAEGNCAPARTKDVSGSRRAGENEGRLGNPARRDNQQGVEHRLPVRAVGSEVSKLPLRLDLDGPVLIRVGGAIENARTRAAVTLLDQIKDRAAGEGEEQVEARNETRRQIVGLS